MKNRQNKFEETRMLSARALELSRGAKPKIKLDPKKVYLAKDWVLVAKEELDKGLLDLEIYRTKDIH